MTHKLKPGHNDANNAGEQALDALGYGCILVAGLALAARRFPMTVLAVVTAAIVVYATRTYTGGPVYVAPVIAMYTVGTVYPRRQWVPAVVSAGIISTVGSSITPTRGRVGSTSCTSRGASRPGSSVPGCSCGGVVYTATLEERAKFLEETPGSAPAGGRGAPAHHT